MIKLDISPILGFIPDDVIEVLQPESMAAIDSLESRTGQGKEFLGWLNPGLLANKELLAELNETANLLKENCDVVVVAGIGGSYLGSKAVIEALNDNFYWLREDRSNPVVLYAGQNLSEDYIAELINYLKDKRFGIINISKSGTTTETALAFRILKRECENQRGKDMAKKVIVAITDASKGAARICADQEGYRSFIIPDNVGGRYSVLTPAGLLPIAVAGFSIDKLVEGAQDMSVKTSGKISFWENPAAVYASARNALYNSGKKIEILVNYNPKLHYFAEWWKQLFGESEGKDGKGLFPASVDFTTDLHSMGQWIQQGERTIFETVISIDKVDNEVVIPFDSDNFDGLNFLTGKRVDQANKMAELGTRLAHIDGGVPNIRILIPQLNEYWLGQLIYLFEKSCGISGYLLRVNPFDQPGVEMYKKNMFALLEKPGYEIESEQIKRRLRE